MIERTGADDFTLTCDSCGYDESTFFETFQEAVDWKKGIGKDEGWRSRMDKKHVVWMDLCPDCSGAGEGEATGSGDFLSGF